jgi:hypothetical protein
MQAQGVFAAPFTGSNMRANQNKNQSPFLIVCNTLNSVPSLRKQLS